MPRDPIEIYSNRIIPSLKVQMKHPQKSRSSRGIALIWGHAIGVLHIRAMMRWDLLQKKTQAHPRCANSFAPWWHRWWNNIGPPSVAQRASNHGRSTQGGTWRHGVSLAGPRESKKNLNFMPSAEKNGLEWYWDVLNGWFLMFFAIVLMVLDGF